MPHRPALPSPSYGRVVHRRRHRPRPAGRGYSGPGGRRARRLRRRHLRGVRRGRQHVIGVEPRLRGALQPHRRGRSTCRGTSVQYRSSGGTSNPSGVTTLSGSVPAKGYFLVGEATGSSGAAVPTPAVERVDRHERHGRHRLPGRPDHGPDRHRRPARSRVTRPSWTSSGTAARTPSRPQPRRPPRTSTSAARDASGQGHERQLRGPHRRRRHTRCGARGRYDGAAGRPGRGHDRGDPGHRFQPARSPASAVTTSGVVTAAYPTGGFNGFYLQTAGTGGEVDPATHQASDAVFVFGSAATGVVQRRRPRRGDRQGDRVRGHHRDHRLAAADVKVLADPASVSPARVVLPRTEAAASRSRGCCSRRAGRYTVADNYALNQYAEIGLAAGTHPLFAPTEVADPHDAAAIAAVEGGQRSAFGDPRRRRDRELLRHCQEHAAALPDPGPRRSGSGLRRGSRSPWCSSGASTSGGSSRPTS